MGPTLSAISIIAGPQKHYNASLHNKCCLVYSTCHVVKLSKIVSFEKNSLSMISKSESRARCVIEKATKWVEFLQISIIAKFWQPTKMTFTCSKSIIETLEKSVN